jgi:hypothetical protein
MNNALAKGRAWILSHGGATLVPQWGKIWLSVCFVIHETSSILHVTTSGNAWRIGNCGEANLIVHA